MKRTSKIKNLKDLDKKIAELLEVQEVIAQYETIAENLRDEIKACMADSEEIITENHKVRWTTVASNRFNQSTFKTVHPDLYEQFKTSSVSRRFTVV